VNIASASEHPLEAELKTRSVLLLFADDWADVHAGRYEEVAQRVLRHAKSRWQRGIIVRSVIGVFAVYELVRYFQTSRVPDLVSGGAVGLCLLSLQLLAFLAYRNAVFVADRLRRAAVEAPRSEAVQ
jgi:hypothetical protein